MKIINIEYILNLQNIDKFAKLIAMNIDISDVILLTGNLGAGKTSLIQMIFPDASVSSPSFGLYHIYETSHKKSIWHYDLYRLKDKISQNDLQNLDLEEAIQNNITIIEWADKIDFELNMDSIAIDISYNPENLSERLYKIKFFDNSKFNKIFFNRTPVFQYFDK